VNSPGVQSGDVEVLRRGGHDGYLQIRGGLYGGARCGETTRWNHGSFHTSAM
jgi:hypothetical protein